MIQATPKTLSMYTQYTKNLVGENTPTSLSFKLTNDYEEIEGTQMLKNPIFSPTLLFFLSVFHTIATLKFMSNEKP